MDKILFIVTGSSKGLGLALTQKILEQNYPVFGISRSNQIVHSNFEFIAFDLANVHDLDDININLPPYITKVCLINNAGVLGDVDYAQNIDSNAIINLFNINLLAPIILTKNLIKKCQNEKLILDVINISSGAGRRVIPSWSNYGTSKAALDFFTLAIQEEAKELNLNNSYSSLAPGVIDTNMQQQIRSVSTEKFSSLPYFIELKQEGKLRSTNETAKLILETYLNNNLEKGITRI